MIRAINLALENVTAGAGGPFAALVVRDGVVIAEGTNMVSTSHDPTAHAEMIAIRRACQELEKADLTDCEIYTTCEPCLMCVGAILWSKPDRVFYGATRGDAAAAGFDDAFMYAMLKLPPNSRIVPFVPMMRCNSRTIFDAWVAAKGRGA